MASGRRSRLGEGLSVVTLIVLSAVMLLSLNAMAWPFGGLAHVAATQSNAEPGTLTVILTLENRTIPSGAPQGQPTFETATDSVQVTVYAQGTQNVVANSQTNSSGVSSTSLPPSSYTVKIVDPSFSNLTVNLQVVGGETTTLHANLNETNYLVSAFDLMDSDSSNYVGGWNGLFARIETNQTIPSGYGVTTYVRFLTNYYGDFPVSGVGSSFNVTTISSLIRNVTLVNTSNLTVVFIQIPFFPSTTVPASIVSSSKDNDSQWLQLSLSQFNSVEQVTGLEIITHAVSDTVNTTSAS